MKSLINKLMALALLASVFLIPSLSHAQWFGGDDSSAIVGASNVVAGNTCGVDPKPYVPEFVQMCQNFANSSVTVPVPDLFGTETTTVTMTTMDCNKFTACLSQKMVGANPQDLLKDMCGTVPVNAGSECIQKENACMSDLNSVYFLTQVVSGVLKGQCYYKQGSGYFCSPGFIVQAEESLPTHLIKSALEVEAACPTSTQAQATTGGGDGSGDSPRAPWEKPKPHEPMFECPNCHP